MTSLSLVLQDSGTMLRRNLRHAVRYPSMALGTVVMPAGLLLLFVFAFGGVMGKGLAGSTGNGSYVDYLSPGVCLLAIAANAMVTSVSVAVDMTRGIINRFRTMAIARSSVLTGHVLGSVIQAVASVILVLLTAVAAGFRPTAGVLGWLGALGLLALVSFALSWIAVCLGLVAKTVSTASNTPMVLQIFPFLSSAFVPANSMSPGLRWFSEYQPFTPINETVRGLLTGSAIGNDWILALAWCVAISAVGYAWARALFRRDPRTT